MTITEAESEPQPQIEVDFLGLQKQNNSSSSDDHHAQPQPRLDRRRSFRDISKIKPEIVKSVIASAARGKSGSLKCPCSSAPGSPLPPRSSIPQFHVSPSNKREYDSLEKVREAAPMTIFYNGTVAVFHLPVEKAQGIIDLAMESEGSASKNDAHFQHSSFNTQRENILDQELNHGDEVCCVPQYVLPNFDSDAVEN